MLNVLINAYACCPNWGSESGMAWHWIENLSKYCNLYIITEGEWEKDIIKAVDKLPQKKNIHFYFNPVSEKVRKMCWNQGDWRFYYYYRKWQKQALQIARTICAEHTIDITHQLNMVGFREPGYLWKIEGVKHVWGPIGSMGFYPLDYLHGASLKNRMQYIIKNIITEIQIISPHIRAAITHSDKLIAAVDVTKEKIKKYYGKEVLVINETGCEIKELTHHHNFRKKSLDILWVGRFIFSKQLSIALNVIALLKDKQYDFTLHIIGYGTRAEETKYKKEAISLGVNEKCKWYGKVENARVQELMQECDLFFFTSVVEGTPHVVLEAITNCLPILCFDICGQGVAVNESIGFKIQPSNFKGSVKKFYTELCKIFNNRELLEEKSSACLKRQRELSWESKAKNMIGIYEKVQKT